MIDLTGRVAVVTSAGRGLGRSHEDVADEADAIESTEPMRIPGSMVDDLTATLDLFSC